MKSPFPGMDPFLQQRWGDFHTSFSTYLRDAINPSLPAGLRARVEERVAVEFEDDEEAQPQSYRPDVHVFESPRGPFDGNGAAAAVLQEVAEPILIPFPPPMEHPVVIRDVKSGGKLVTVIELLSVTNKSAGKGHSDYRDKQGQYVDAGASLLELDLIRGGQPTTVADWNPGDMPLESKTLYHASLLNRPRGRTEYYPIPLDKPLPRIALPLRRTDRPIAVDFQAVLDLAYERGYYSDDLTYHAPLDPPPNDADAAYIRERLAAWEA